MRGRLLAIGAFFQVSVNMTDWILPLNPILSPISFPWFVRLAHEMDAGVSNPTQSDPTECLTSNVEWSLTFCFLKPGTHKKPVSWAHLIPLAIQAMWSQNEAWLGTYINYQEKTRPLSCSRSFPFFHPHSFHVILPWINLLNSSPSSRRPKQWPICALKRRGPFFRISPLKANISRPCLLIPRVRSACRTGMVSAY